MTRPAELFHENYRVVSVEAQHLTLRGERSGTIVTVKNADPDAPLSAEVYPPGQLIALSDPALEIVN
jgi:hypothetical protein